MKKVITAIILTALCVNLFGCASSTPEASTTSSNDTENVSASNTSVDADSVEEDDDNDDNNIHIKENKEWSIDMLKGLETKEKVTFKLGDKETFLNTFGREDYSDYTDNRNILSTNGEYGTSIVIWDKVSQNYTTNITEIIEKVDVVSHIFYDKAYEKITKDCNPYDATFVKESEEKVKIGNKECMKYIGIIQLDADKGTFYAECYTFFVDSTPCYILSVMLNDIKTDKGDKAAMEEKINYIISSAYSKN